MTKWNGTSFVGFPHMYKICSLEVLVQVLQIKNTFTSDLIECAKREGKNLRVQAFFMTRQNFSSFEILTSTDN